MNLPEGGVLIAWWAKGFPGWSLDKAQGDIFAVGGHRAKLRTDRPGDCRRIGADETVTATTARDAAANWFEMNACLRGPGLQAEEAQVRAMLASTTFAVFGDRIERSGPWVTAGRMVEPRALHTATVLPDGRLLVVGGVGASGGDAALATAEVYHAAAQSWSPGGVMSIGRTSHTATLLPDGRVLVAGGVSRENGGSPLASTEFYDPITNTWSSGPPMLAARSGHTATLLPNGKVLAVGGGADTAELFDPTANRWASASRPPSAGFAGFGQTATTLATGKILFAPGFTQDGMPAGKGALYDPVSDVWSDAAPMNWGQTSATGAAKLSNGKVLVVGMTAAGIISSTAELYEPTSDSWTPAWSDRPNGRFNFWAVVALAGAKALALPAMDSTTGALAAQVYDATTNSWTPAGVLVHPPFYGFTATRLADDTVLVVGGITGDGLGDVEMYKPGG
jgi:N-acetylneuraminic acid mutarotase